MTSLVSPLHGGSFAAISQPAAGDLAKQVARLTLAAVKQLRAGTKAGSSWAFNDLRNLAAESSRSICEDATFVMAERFLLALPGYIPAPSLDLDADGEVVLDWSGTMGRMMTLSIRHDGRLSYAARVSPSRRKHGTDLFIDSIPTDVLDLANEVTKT